MTTPGRSERKEQAPPELAPGAGRRWGRALETFGPLVALGLLVALTTAFNPRFLLPENVLNVLEDLSFRGVIALGMTFVIILGGIDLSVGSLVAFCGGLGIYLMNTVINAPAILDAVAHAERAGAAAPHGALRVALAAACEWIGLGGSEAWGVAAAFAIVPLAGFGAGLLNGVLVAKGRVAPFIATLGGLAAYRSLALSLADGGEFRSASAELFKSVGTGGIPLPWLTNQYGNPLVLRWPVLAFVVLALAAHVALHRTRYGRYVYAIGANERAAVYSAIAVDRIKVATYALTGLLTGVAALMNASRMNSVSSGQTGALWELDAIAAVVIGGTRMTGGVGRVWGTVVGLLILGVIGNMLNLLQVSPYLQGLVKGFIIVAAVLLQRGRRPE
jgi:ribose transport system permease protein